MRRSSFAYLRQLIDYATANESHLSRQLSLRPHLALHAANRLCPESATSGSLNSWSPRCNLNVQDEEQPCQGLPRIQHRLFAARHTRSKRVEAALQRQNPKSTSMQRQAASPTDGVDTSAIQGERNVVAADTSATRVEVANVVRHPALIVAREIEWGTVILGFEQCNKYTVLDETGATVALLAEDVGGIGTAVGRQVLRRRRPFKATVFTADGSRIIFQLERPFYLINSSIFIKDGDGNVVGEVHQRWHLWRRKYALYINRAQFAAIDGGLLAWEFVLRDATGGVLALIDRNFQGFGKELFTDAGKYVVHFGNRPQEAAEQVANTIQAAHPDKPRPPVTALAKARNDLTVIPTAAGGQLDVVRNLGISERAAVLAAAISIDFDYFSQHSSGSGMFPWMIPMSPSPPYPDDAAPEGSPADSADDQQSDGGSRAGDVGAAGEGAAAGGGGAAGGAAATSSGTEGSGSSGFRGTGDLGNDTFGSGSSSSPEADLGNDGWGGGDGFGDAIDDAAPDEGSGMLSDLSDMLSGWGDN